MFSYMLLYEIVCMNYESIPQAGILTKANNCLMFMLVKVIACNVMYLQFCRTHVPNTYICAESIARKVK